MRESHILCLLSAWLGKEFQQSKPAIPAKSRLYHRRKAAATVVLIRDKSNEESAIFPERTSVFSET